MHYCPHSYRVVSVLLTRTPEAVDLANGDDATALHLASEAGHVSTVDELLQRNADRSKK